MLFFVKKLNKSVWSYSQKHGRASIFVVNYFLESYSALEYIFNTKINNSIVWEIFSVDTFVPTFFNYLFLGHFCNLPRGRYR